MVAPALTCTSGLELEAACAGPRSPSAARRIAPRAARRADSRAAHRTVARSAFSSAAVIGGRARSSLGVSSIACHEPLAVSHELCREIAWGSIGGHVPASVAPSNPATAPPDTPVPATGGPLGRATPAMPRPAAAIWGPCRPAAGAPASSATPVPATGGPIGLAARALATFAPATGQAVRPAAPAINAPAPASDSTPDRGAWTPIPGGRSRVWSVAGVAESDLVTGGASLVPVEPNAATTRSSNCRFYCLFRQAMMPRSSSW